MSTESENVRDIVFRIRRFDPARDSEPYYQDFTVPVPPGMVVLDGLWYIKEKLDPSLAWRSSCRMGVCGSCGMLINGKPTLACNTQTRDVCSDILTIAPLPNFGIVRDLVPDLQPMFELHADLIPYVQRADISGTENPTDQFWQSQEDLEKYLQFSYCIKCGCCMAACPVVATDEVYSGPQPLSQAYRYMIDSRNDDFLERKEKYAREVGPWRCHYAGECSAVCPKGVDPARAIQLMKRELVLDYLRLGKLRKRQAAPPMPAENKRGRREGIPEPPPLTVEGTG